MARKPRIEFKGALTHIITRGNHREPVFRDQTDYLHYLHILSRYKLRYPFFLYAYALMGNHVHLLIETQETPLCKILQGINQSQTLYFNRKYKTAGHLFQGRYKVILCDKDRHFLALVRYIHLNPVRAGIADAAGGYPWTSHHSYMETCLNQHGEKEKHGHDGVDTDKLLTMLSCNKRYSLNLYNEYMGEAQIITSDLRLEETDTGGGCILEKGSTFMPQINTQKQRFMPGEPFMQAKREKKTKDYTLHEIASAVEKVYGVTKEQILSHTKSRHVSCARNLFCAAAEVFAYPGKEVAAFIGKDPAVVSRHLRHKNDAALEIEKLIRKLKEKQNHELQSPILNSHEKGTDLFLQYA